MLSNITNSRTMNKELEYYAQSNSLPFHCGSDGPLTTKIAIIAEAPGERECQLKIPLVGSTGAVLWDALRKESLRRTDCYITNVIKRRVASITNASGKVVKTTIGKQELQVWKDLLIEELSQLPNLRYVLILGNFALSALLNEKNITNHRGSIVNGKIKDKDVIFFCANNPALVFHNPLTEVVFRMDIGKFRRVLDNKYHIPVINSLINPTYQEALDYINYCKHAKEEVSFDIETMANETACVGIAPSNTEGMCINWRSQGNNVYTLEEERNIRLALQDLFSQEHIRFIAQNANFDMYWLWYKDRIKVHRTYFDTMLAHHTLYPSLPHNLGFLTAQYTDHPYYKDDGHAWRDENDIDMFWRYNVTDCCITRMVYQEELKELQNQKLDNFFFNHVMRLQPHLVRMTVNGVLADTELKDKIIDELGKDVEQARDLCIKAARACLGDNNYTFNPNSHHQLSALLFEKLRLVGRGTRTDKENRDRVRNHPKTDERAKELITRIDNYLEKAKFYSTYAKSRLDPDNKFRCEYKQTGVQSAPGRLSSSQTMWGNGLNNQNIPEEAKPMFIAPPGYVFLYFDKAQIEARFVACFAKIDRWLDQFEMARLNPGSYDAHCALASDMFNIPYDEVPKKDIDASGNRTIRYIAKRCRHGLNYRMGPDTLAVKADLTPIEALKNYNIYHRTTPELRKWWSATVEEAKTKRVLFTPYGRRWIMLGKFDDTAMDSIIALRPQSTAGDHVASIIYEATEDPDWPNEYAAVAINIHDALITLVKEEYVDQVKRVLDKYNNKPIHINGIDMIVPADYGISKPDEHGIHRWSTIEKF